MKSRSLHFSSAFSLVELTIALGLVSFVLIALLGLFSVGLNSSRASANDTATAQIANQVISRAGGSDCPAPGADPKIYYFEVDGTETSSGSQSLYKAELSSRLPDAGTELSGVSDRLLLLSIKISWPDGTKTIFASRLAD